MNNHTRLLVHPMFLFSLFILLVNDHILKAVYPSVVTGKLSDFSGLFVFAVFLAAIGNRYLVSRRSLILLHISIGVAFAIFKVAPIETLQDTIIFKTGLPLPGRTKDATDLMALSVLPLSYWFLIRQGNAGAVFDRKKILLVVKSLILCTAAFAIIATTPPKRPAYTVEESVQFISGDPAEVIFKIQQALVRRGFELRELTTEQDQGGSRYMLTSDFDNKCAINKEDSIKDYSIKLSAIVYLSGFGNQSLAVDSISTRIDKPKDKPEIIDRFIRDYILSPIKTLRGVR